MSDISLFTERLQHYKVNGVDIAVRVGGTGPALLLLHGHPETHVMWHRLWPQLTNRYTCVAMDLRGYGDSGMPAEEPGHAAFSKRAMALDAVEVMRCVGYDTFGVLAHDRGARVAHRLVLDHPERVERMMLLDIAPTLDMYEGTTRGFAQSYYHWFWLIQPAPMPERMIEAADPAFYVRSLMGGRHAGLGPFDARALAEYERCARHAHWAHAICEDYRASATLDLDHDREDRANGARIECPLRVLWGGRGVVDKYFDVLDLWRRQAASVEGRALDCGHYLAEEAPDALWAEVSAFFPV